MKINVFLVVLFLSFTLLAYSGLFENQTERIGGTQLNGDGCVCHSLYEDTTVKVWIEGPETLTVGQTGIYKMFLAGGPAEAGGYNVAGRFGLMGAIDSLSVWDYRAPNELTQAFPLLFPTQQDTISWHFEYTASDSSEVDTIYSTGLSLIYDGIPDSLDRWGYGPKFPLIIINDVTPVEISSFSVELNKETALLNWTTATELNNKGFEIEKTLSLTSPVQGWEKIGFIEGKGTTAERNDYHFIDLNLKNGISLYRLKQIDYDGKYQYSNVVELKTGDILSDFELSQNYPNPFNPTTKIKFIIPKSSFVNLKVYDVLGIEVATLVNEEKSAGKYEVNFGANFLSSGIYFCKIEVGNRQVFTQTRKMLLLK